MIFNYVKLSFRLLFRNPFFTFINVAGLAVGFASFFALWQYASLELKTDQYHKDFERIARIGMIRIRTDGSGHQSTITLGISDINVVPRLKEDYPEVESFVRIMNQAEFKKEMVGHERSIVIAFNPPDGQQRIFKETKAVYADPNLFEFFSIPLLSGDAKKVLAEPNNIVLSQTASIKYFGTQNPVGKILLLNDSVALKVSGVYQDLPNNTHLNFDLVISNKGHEKNWDNALFGLAHCYIKLNQSKPFGDFERRINSNKLKYWANLFQASPGMDLDMFVQPLDEIAFSNSTNEDGFYAKSKATLLILQVVSILILLMAWINYINLSISRTSKRGKELATRKVVGAVSSDFIKQFLIESFAINSLAMALAITLLQIIRTPFLTLFNIHVVEFSALSIESSFLIILIITGGIFITGLYPVFITMRNHPRSLITMNSKPNGKRLLPSILTTVQFIAAISLILWGSIVFLQLNYILHKEIGIDKNAVIIIDAPVIKSTNYVQDVESLKSQILVNPQVKNVAFSNAMAGDVVGGNFYIKTFGSDNPYGVDLNGGVSENYVNFYGIKLLAGRNFIKDDRDDVVVISRITADRIGFKNPEEAIGASINARLYRQEWKVVEIIGVIEDYRIASYFQPHEGNPLANGRGLCLTYKNKLFPELIPEKIAIKILTENVDEVVSQIESSFQDIFPGNVFTWYFLDDHVNRFYGNEKIARNQIILFTILAIGIACMGLLGMIANKVDEKTKEIGIRKVLGARMHQIAQILLNTTVRQFTVAALLGIPVAYYFVQQYLQKFSERVTLHWWHYAIPVGLLLFIMFITIASVLFKAARTNPVESLRYE